MELTQSMKNALISAAAAIGTDPEWLRRLIYFETARTYDPQITNPNTGAIGLIQFMDSAAQDLGFDRAADLAARWPDFESQLQNAVVPWLKRYGPYPTEQSLYMQVFYPAARSWDPLKPFSDSVQAANPGIKTPADYISLVNGSIAKAAKAAAQIGGSALAVIAAILGAIFFLKSRG